MEILVKRHADVQLPEKVPIGDWVDLRVSEGTDLTTGVN